MPNFVLNKNAQSNGDYEVHNLDANMWCLPATTNQLALGYHSGCSGAVAKAKELGYSRANGCYHCAAACHTS